MEITVSNGGRQIQRNHRIMIHQSKRSSWTGVEDEEISYYISLFFLFFKRHCCIVYFSFFIYIPSQFCHFIPPFRCVLLFCLCVYLLVHLLIFIIFQSNNNHYYLFSF